MPSASAGLSRNKDNAAASLGGDMDFPHISSVRFALEVEVGEPSALSHWCSLIMFGTSTGEYL